MTNIFDYTNKFPIEANALNIPWDWVGIIGTGQSLAVGTNGTPILSTSQPYKNLKLSISSITDPPFDANSSSLSMEPLIEPIHQLAPGYPSPYPYNIYGETPHSAMANQVSALALEVAGVDYITAHTVVGECGQGMFAIKKGAIDTGETGRAYDASLFEVTAINRIAKASGKTYGIGGILLTHGETDCCDPNYKNAIYKMWSDYNEDIKNITGQTQTVTLFLCQQNAAPAPNAPGLGMLGQWEVGLEHPGKIVCIGPLYQYLYIDDGVHLKTQGYQMLGEKYGEIYFQKAVLSIDWKPLQPTNVSRDGRVITVNFYVPVPPLSWNTEFPLPNQDTLTEWKNGKGFEVTALESRVIIDSVEIEGNSVKITCSDDLPSSGVKVGYAFTTTGDKRDNGTFRWGLLCDSDPFIGSSTGIILPNYCVAFELPIP